MDSLSSSDHTPDTSPRPTKHRKRISGEIREHRTSHSHTKRRSKDVAPSSSSRELARLLVFEEKEIKELQRALFAMTEQLKMERQRADDADRKALDTAYKFRQAENARVNAELNYARASEELRLYKLQLDNAQKEIFRAEEVIADVEKLRKEAEAEAIRSRSAERALKAEKLVQSAREEGRRLGMQEGMQRGRDIGYQEGRVHGYEQGRETAEHILDRVYYDEIDEDRERDRGRNRARERDREERRSESNTEPRWESERRYDPRHGRGRDLESERDRDRPSSSSFDPRRERFEPAPSEGTYPRPPSVVIPETPVHSAPPSPRHDVPPDNWIPDQDADARIRLPPPHEMQRPPISRTPSPPLPPVPEEEEEPVLPIPAPEFEVQRSNGSGRHRRRSSSPTSESSGRTSELDLLAAPRQYAGRGYTERLSVIREGNSVENTPSQQTMRTASTPTVVRQPSMTLRETPPRYVQPPTPRTTDYYRRARSPEDDSAARSPPVSMPRPPSVSMPRPPSVPPTRPPSVPVTRPPSVTVTRPPSVPAARPPSVPPARPPSFPSATLAEPKPERRSRSSSVNSEIGINVEPPSRPQSNSSKEGAAGVASLLSPRDADRPIPLPGEPSHPVIPEESVPVISHLPPGFMVTGPPVSDIPSSQPPSSSRPPMHSRTSSGGSRGYTARTNIYGPPSSGPSHYGAAPPVVPGGFPPMGDQYMSMSTHGSYRTLDPSMDNAEIPMPTTMPVIPPPSSNYARYDDDSQSTSSSSANTLSTPPPRRMRMGRGSDSDYGYEPAPVPVSMASYDAGLPVPPPVGTPRHIYQAPSSSARGPSRVGSATPRTRPISIYGAAATMNAGEGGRPSDSKPSLNSSASYKHFDRNEYLDPALLASASSSVEDVSEVGLGPSKGRGHGSGRSRR